MPTFLLIRHGENDYVKKGRLAGHIPGVHLNERGRQQAAALAEKLTNAPLKAIYSSPLERAMETAAPLGEKFNLPVLPRPGLIETDPGEWQGKTVKSLSRLKVWRGLQVAPSLFRFPGGESISQCQARLVAEMEALRSMHEDKDLVACVLHADPIKLIVAYYLGLPVDSFQRLSVGPASLSIVYIGAEHARLFMLNYDPSFAFPPPKEEKEKTK
jgi:probable phosphomutase (TIGR03848 family)